MFSQHLSIAAVSIAALAGASTLQINNRCIETLYLTLTNPSAPYPDTVEEVLSGQAYVAAGDNAGEGNSLAISSSKDFYKEGTPKFIIGYSVTGGRLWWSTGQSDGDMFADLDRDMHFNITTPDSEGNVVCGSTEGYDQGNHNCEDGAFVLTFNPCLTE